MLRPQRHLVEAARRFPGAWKDVDLLRAGRGKNLPDWPEWCFMPMAGFAVITGARGGEANVLDTGILSALGTWRVTQGVYRFDEEVMDGLWETPVKGELPVELLYRLPEWCVYVETPGRLLGERALQGFFAHLEWDANHGHHELRFLLDSERGLSPFPLRLPRRSGGTLGELVDAALDDTARVAEGQGLGEEFRRYREAMRSLGEEISHLLSVLLYLCSTSADYRDASGSAGGLRKKPVPKKTKKGLRTFPPDRPTVWETGHRMGASLRAAREREERAGGEGTARGQALKPHWRRAHWHGYWTGPRDIPGEREFVLKWLPPIAVKVETSADLVPTVRPVEGSNTHGVRT